MAAHTKGDSGKRGRERRDGGRNMFDPRQVLEVGVLCPYTFTWLWDGARPAISNSTAITGHRAWYLMGLERGYVAVAGR